MTNIHAVVVTYNGLKWLKLCLNSLENSSVKLHIVVVDNGSKDGSVEYIKNNFNNVLLIETNENLGFGKANNIGIKRAIEEGADYLFLLNQDAWIDYYVIEGLIKIHEQNPNYGIIAPFRKVSDGHIENDVFLNVVQKGDSAILSDLYFKNKLEDVYKIDFIGAAAWLISRECIEAVGGFDPIFFHYGEDNDYCYRVKLAGFDIGICPNLIITHDTGTREPDKKMLKRRRFASIILTLRYHTLSHINKLYYYIKYYYMIALYKIDVSNKNKLICKIHLNEYKVNL